MTDGDSMTINNLHDFAKKDLRHPGRLPHNYMLRSVDLNSGVWQCAFDMLQVDAVQLDTVRNIASPTGAGRSGLAERRAGAVFQRVGPVGPIVVPPLRLVTLQWQSRWSV